MHPSGNYLVGFLSVREDSGRRQAPDVCLPARRIGAIVINRVTDTGPDRKRRPQRRLQRTVSRAIFLTWISVSEGICRGNPSRQARRLHATTIHVTRPKLAALVGEKNVILQLQRTVRKGILAPAEKGQAHFVNGFLEHGVLVFVLLVQMLIQDIPSSLMILLIAPLVVI